MHGWESSWRILTRTKISSANVAVAAESEAALWRANQAKTELPQSKEYKVKTVSSNDKKPLAAGVIKNQKDMRKFLLSQLGLSQKKSGMKSNLIHTTETTKDSILLLMQRSRCHSSARSPDWCVKTYVQ